MQIKGEHMRKRRKIPDDQPPGRIGAWVARLRKARKDKAKAKRMAKDIPASKEWNDDAWLP